MDWLVQDDSTLGGALLHNLIAVALTVGFVGAMFLIGAGVLNAGEWLVRRFRQR